MRPTSRVLPYTEHNADCWFCGAKAGSPCTDKRGVVQSPHSCRFETYCKSLPKGLFTRIHGLRDMKAIENCTNKRRKPSTPAIAYRPVHGGYQGDIRVPIGIYIDPRFFDRWKKDKKFLEVRMP